MQWIHFVGLLSKRELFYTLLRYPFIGKLTAKCGSLFDNVQRAICFNDRNRAMDKMPSVAKKRLLRKKFIQQFMSAF